MTADAFGAPRVIGPTLCSGSPAAIVDIGASEHAYPLPSCPATAPSSPPQLSSLKQTAKKWREGKLSARISTSGKGRKKLPVGTTFSFTLDSAAQVEFKFVRAVPGRRAGKRCVAPTRKNRHKRRCTRRSVAGTLAFSAHAGADKVRFQGVLAKGKRLPAGSYTLLVTASASGKRSHTATLTFAIVR